MTIRGERRKGEVLVTVDGAPLDWRSSLAVRNHSPTGPAWGYGGSGPAQLALAILLAVTDAATAERFYQQSKWSVIAPIEADRRPLDAGDVLHWLESAAGGTDGVVPVAVETEVAAVCWERICRRRFRSVGRRWRGSAWAVRRSSPSTCVCRCRRRVRTAAATCSPGRTSRFQSRRAGRRSTRCGSGGPKP